MTEVVRAQRTGSSWEPTTRRWAAWFLCFVLIVSGFAQVGGVHALEHDALALAPALSADSLHPSRGTAQPCIDGVAQSFDETCSLSVACSLAVPLATAGVSEAGSTSNPTLTTVESYCGRRVGLTVPPPKLAVQI